MTMTIGELIACLSVLPKETKVLLNDDCGWRELCPEDVEYMKAFSVWHSDYNNNKKPYTSFCSEPQDSVYVRGAGLPDYVRKTVGEEYILLLG